MTAHPDFNRPKGIQRIRPLPDPALGRLWDSIILPAPMKEQLVSQAMLNFSIRGKVDRSVLHGTESRLTVTRFEGFRAGRLDSSLLAFVVS